MTRGQLVARVATFAIILYSGLALVLGIGMLAVQAAPR